MIERTSDLLAGLNPEQREAVTATEGPVLVVAGPGSGKTRVLTHRIAFLIEECGVLPDRILAVTFTNKAAREMRNRIEAILGGGATRGLVMGTFHSLGVLFLRQNPGLVADRLGLLPNFLIYDDADQLAVAKNAIAAIGQDVKQVAPRRMLSRISAAKSLLIGPEEFANQTETYGDEIVARVYAEYQRALRKANAVDFDDLLALPIRLFDEAPALLQRYQDRFQYILVDEYQDTNRVQYVLVSALAAQHRNIFVVGDPDQSIYAWRQADIRNILDFEKDYPDARLIRLELNYRSTRRIVETADRVIQENTQRIERSLRTDNEDGNPVILNELPDQNAEAGYIARETTRLMRRDGLSPDHVAVMYRTTAQSRVLEEAFRREGVPYRIVGGVRFYDRKEVKHVLAVLRLLHNPADEVSLERVIGNFPLGRGIGPKAIETVRTWATLNGRPLLDGFVALSPALATEGAPELAGSARTAAARLGTFFAKLREEVGTVALGELFDRVVDRSGYRGSFDHESEEEMQRWANVEELRADLERYDVAGVEPREALATYLEQVALIADVDALEEGDAGKVTLITLHSAKGLEFPVVFIAGVEEGLLPISRAVEVEAMDPLPLEEERRLFYVGITRAQKLLYLTSASSRLGYGRWQPGVPSRFLTALPPQHVHTVAARPLRPGATGYGGRLQDRVRPANGRAARDSYPVPAPEPAPAARPAAVYSAGQHIFHAKYGDGRIIAVVDRRDDQELRVAFVRHGEKLLLASMAPLDVIAE